MVRAARGGEADCAPGESDDAVTGAFLRAFERRSSRAESLCHLAICLRERGRVVAGYPFARAASETPRPDDILFIDESVYAWRAKDEFAVAAYWLGRYRESQAASEELLASGSLPRQRGRASRRTSPSAARSSPARHAVSPWASPAAVARSKSRLLVPDHSLQQITYTVSPLGVEVSIPHDQPRGVVVPVVNNGVSRYMGSLVDVVQPPPVAMVSLGQYRLASVTELANVSS